MSKTKKIIYWIATVWFSFGMLSSGIVQLIRLEEEVAGMTRLGYPVYFLTILGVWKVLGVIVLLIPKFALVKEWAYAGFFFAMTGATISHLALSDPFKETFPSILLTALMITSWFLRPESRKIASVNQ